MRYHVFGKVYVVLSRRQPNLLPSSKPQKVCRLSSCGLIACPGGEDSWQPRRNIFHEVEAQDDPHHFWTSLFCWRYLFPRNLMILITLSNDSKFHLLGYEFSVGRISIPFQVCSLLLSDCKQVENLEWSILIHILILVLCSLFQSLKCNIHRTAHANFRFMVGQSAPILAEVDKSREYTVQRILMDISIVTVTELH